MVFFAEANILFDYRLQSLISHTLDTVKHLVACHCPQKIDICIIRSKFNSDTPYKTAKATVPKITEAK